MNSDREAILMRVRDALAALKERAPLPEWDSLCVEMRKVHNADNPRAQFTERLKALNGVVFESAAELVAFLDGKQWRRGYCDPKLWSGLKGFFPKEFTVELEFDRLRIDEYEFGITAATGAIAETGTLILSDGGTSTRLGALAPWVHIAVLPEERIVSDITTALASLSNDPNIVWCTGPSRTADVEGILIEGVHGPGIQGVLILGRNPL